MASTDKVVGIIGGMGPEATVDFMSRVLLATPAVKDQDHVRMIVENNPRIPSRQAAMKGEGEDPGRSNCRNRGSFGDGRCRFSSNALQPGTCVAK